MIIVLQCDLLSNDCWIFTFHQVSNMCQSNILHSEHTWTPCGGKVKIIDVFGAALWLLLVCGISNYLSFLWRSVFPNVTSSLTLLSAINLFSWIEFASHFTVWMPFPWCCWTPCISMPCTFSVHSYRHAHF